MLTRKFFFANKYLIIAFFSALMIKISSFYPYFIENYYVPYFFQPFAKLQRMLLGWLPVSFGDLVYILLLIGIFYFFYQLWLKIRQKSFTKIYRMVLLKKVLTFFLFLYSIFHICWGLNYSRLGIAHQLDIKVEKIRKTDVQNVLAQIIVQLNEAAVNLKEDTLFTDNLLSQATQCYDTAKQHYTFIQYENRSVKNTLFARIGNYMGFLGYYNPFTGEAQINPTVPAFMQPNILVHEIAHQIGYAKEDEANFVGYLSVKNNRNVYFRYSVYFDLMQYAASALHQLDSNAVKPFIKSLDPKVRSHLQEWKNFRLAHQSWLTTVSNWLFNNYLKANDRPEGMETYSEVIALLIAYSKKYGLQAI